MYFTFAACRERGYTVLSDDTVLCGHKNGTIIGHSMPLKPSLRVGTLKHLKQMETYRSIFDSAGYHMEDQIYVDVYKNHDADISLHGKITGIFFINFSDSFSVKKCENRKLIKKKLALSICGYKATEVDESLILYLKDLTEQISFYDLFIPKDMNIFIADFDNWVEQEIKHKRIGL